MLIPSAVADLFVLALLAVCSAPLQVAAQAVPAFSGFNYTYSGQPDFAAASEACEYPLLLIVCLIDSLG